MSELLVFLSLGLVALVVGLDALNHAWGWVGDGLAALCVGAAFVGAVLGRELPALAPVAHAAVLLALLVWVLPVVLGTAGGGGRAWGQPDPHPRRRCALFALAAATLLLRQAVAPPGGPPVTPVTPGPQAAGPLPSLEVSR